MALVKKTGLTELLSIQGRKSYSQLCSLELCCSLFDEGFLEEAIDELERIKLAIGIPGDGKYIAIIEESLMQALKMTAEKTSTEKVLAVAQKANDLFPKSHSINFTTGTLLMKVEKKK